MERAYKKKIRELKTSTCNSFYDSLSDSTVSYSYNSNGEKEGLSESSVEEHVTNMSFHMIEEQVLSNLEKWFDGYFHIKENMDKYAPNLTEHSLNEYIKENPLTLTPSHFKDVVYPMDLSSYTHFLSHLSVISEDIDDKLKATIKERIPALLDEVYPTRNQSIEYYAENIITSLSVDFFKDEIGFNIFSHIQEDPTKSFDFYLIQDYANKKILEHENGNNKYTTVSPLYIKLQKILQDKEFSFQNIFHSNLTDNEKQNCLLRFHNLTKHNDLPQEKQKKDIEFIARLNIMPDKANMIILNNFARSHKLPQEEVLTQIIQAYTDKYQIELNLGNNKELSNEDNTLYKL